MSKRLQVIVDDTELHEIKQAAQHQQLTVAEWVRQALRAARRREPHSDATRKLEVVRAAVAHSFPSESVEQMLAEIESGYARSGQP
ncbi:MAG: antitoxin [Gammaproteobacteria bacterium]